MSFIRTGLAILAATGLSATGAAAQTLNLHQAAAFGDPMAIEDLIKSGAPLDAKDMAGRTALLIAVEHNRSEAALVLIAAGADINAQAGNKDTPWLLAGASGRTEILAAMIPKGPDLSIRNRYGGNALIPACERGHADTVKVLLTTAIDVNHVNNLGWTCLLEAVILGGGGAAHQEIVRLVLAAGADANLADRDGTTPLAHARARGQTEIAAMLEQAGGK
jgi:uncharacterized protein